MKKAAIVIVNWNGFRFLEDCLRGVLEQTYSNFEIYFVDNGSQDESVSYVTKTFPSVRLVALTANTGFAKGSNEGIKQALKDSEVAYIVCLNNDTIVEANWLQNLVDTAESSSSIGAVSSKAYFSDGKTINNAGLDYSKTLQINRPGGLSIGFGKTDEQCPDLASDREIFSPGGVAPLYKREVIEKILQRDGEVFDEDFFAYVEDLDLGFRIRSLGYRCFLSAEAKLIHLHSMTGGAASPFKAYYCERNTILTAVKNLPLIDLLMFPLRNVLLKFSYLYNKNVSVNRLTSKIGFAKTFILLLKATLVAFVLMPKFLKKRMKIKITHELHSQ